MSNQTLKEKRQGYMQLARNSAKETNKIRGLLTFVSKKSKKSTYKNKLIDQLLADNTYQKIYAKYMDYVDRNRPRPDAGTTRPREQGARRGASRPR